MWKILIRFRVDARANAQPQVNAQCRKRLVSTTHPIVHDGSEPDRTRGMWIVPNLWKFSSSMPSAVKQGMSQRMCDPRNSSAEPRNGALGVRRRFCFALTPTTGLLSKIETKLGICVPLFHWSWSGRESSESGVALREREPVLHVCWGWVKVSDKLTWQGPLN